jgi:sulfite exporter TauE/SafE
MLHEGVRPLRTLRVVAWHVQCKARHRAMLIQPILLGAATGLASSVHCAAMCGPLAASACSRRPQRAGLLRYQLGRTIGYAAAGAVAGGVGHVAQLSSLAPWLGYAVPAMTVVALLVLARRLLRTGRPALTQLRKVNAPTRSTLFAWLARVAPRDPSVIGALTAFLPCAALGAALLLAASTQKRAAGAALMAGFAVTTALGVLGGGALLGRVLRIGGQLTPRVVAVLLACAALYIGLRPVYALLHAGDAQTPAVSHACH